MSSDTLLVAACVSFLCTAFFLLGFLRLRSKHLNELYIWMSEQVALLDEYRHRKELLEEHTENYINSIGDMGVQSLFTCQMLLMTVEEMLHDVNTRVANGHLDEALAFKQYLTTSDEKALYNSGDLGKYYELNGWEETLEQKIQDLGSEIAYASDSFNSLVTKRRRRKATSMSLKEARIKLVREMTEES